MKKIKIELESTFTPYTLDTYQTFTMEDGDAYLLDIENSKKPNRKKELEYDDFEWDYDTESYLNDLAHNWKICLNENIIDDVILSINYEGKPTDPKEYNYTTNKVYSFFEVNVDKLQKYIKDNQNDYNENKIQSRTGFYWFGDDNQTMLNYYLYNVSSKKYTPTDYYYDQIEGIQTIEYITMKRKKTK
jgi:hypothetical protein